MRLAKHLIDQAELARRAKCSEEKVTAAVKSGRIRPALVIGKVVGFRLENVPQHIQTLALEVE